MINFVSGHNPARVGQVAGLTAYRSDLARGKILQTLKNLYPTCEIGVLLLIIEFSSDPVSIYIRDRVLAALGSFRIYYFSGFTYEDIFACTPMSSYFFRYMRGSQNAPIKVIIPKTMRINWVLGYFKNRYSAAYSGQNILFSGKGTKKDKKLANYIKYFLPLSDVGVVQIFNHGGWDVPENIMLSCELESQRSNKYFLFCF